MKAFVLVEHGDSGAGHSISSAFRVYLSKKLAEEEATRLNKEEEGGGLYYEVVEVDLIE